MVGPEAFSFRAGAFVRVAVAGVRTGIVTASSGWRLWRAAVDVVNASVYGHFGAAVASSCPNANAVAVGLTFDAAIAGVVVFEVAPFGSLAFGGGFVGAYGRGCARALVLGARVRFGCVCALVRRSSGRAFVISARDEGNGTEQQK